MDLPATTDSCAAFISAALTIDRDLQNKSDFLRLAIEPGATRRLRKPFTPAALLAVIKDCLADTVELHRPLHIDSETVK